MRGMVDLGNLLIRVDCIQAVQYNWQHGGLSIQVGNHKYPVNVTIEVLVEKMEAAERELMEEWDQELLTPEEREELDKLLSEFGE